MMNFLRYVLFVYCRKYIIFKTKVGKKDCQRGIAIQGSVVTSLHQRWWLIRLIIVNNCDSAARR